MSTCNLDIQNISTDWEGVSVILYMIEDGKLYFVFGVTKDDECAFEHVAYSSGPRMQMDKKKESHARRELFETTKLYLPFESFADYYVETKVGTLPFYMFFVSIIPEQFNKLKPTYSFDKYIKVEQIFDVSEVVDVITGNKYKIRHGDETYYFPMMRNKFDQKT